jgi:primosomal protein N' (replication factor Y)
LKYADVILPLALPRNYTYQIPEALQEDVLPGCRVTVQFGRNKKYAAVVKEVHSRAPQSYATKPLLDLLDPEPILYPLQLKFWEWLASYYMCTEGEVMHAALPAHLKLTSETRLVFNPAFSGNFSDLADDQYILAEALEVRQVLSMDEVQQLLEKQQVYRVVQELLEKRVCFVEEELREVYRPKEEKFVRLHPRFATEEDLVTAFEEVGKAPRQMETLLAFLHLQKADGIVRQSTLQKKAGSSSAVLKGLVEKNILLIESQVVERIPSGQEDIHIDFTLNDAQQQAYTHIGACFQEKSVVLLQGVTSSGKTMLYIKLIEQMLQAGKQVLYLLPEIALTAQIVQRLQKHFGHRIGIYHSRFNNNERVEIWNKVKDGTYDVILGARSSLLLPFQQLGLVILDEEHDSSYKQQDPAPRYHARDAAIFYAGLAGAKVLLGSATPSMESAYNAKTGKYGHVQLGERYGGMQMPDIELVDMKTMRPGKQSPVPYLSHRLKELMEATLEADKQIILFQNRRGYAPMVVCQTCGWVPHCSHCDVSLTYHKYRHQLHCHYCGNRYPVPTVCAACGSPHLVHRSFGTERIEDDLVTLFPKSRIARMDLDAVRNKEAHHKLIGLFEQRQIDILVGTQMVVKGLDFDHVQLVGIVNADNLLNYPDFRVNERAFQLMEQVSGRAGRKQGRGKVIIQTMQTGHPVLQWVMQHDYEMCYQQEIGERERYFYPPFSRLIRIRLKHRKQELVREAATVLESRLRPLFADHLLGPSAPLVGRVRNYYLVDFLLKLPRRLEVLQKAKADLRHHAMELQASREFRRVMVIPDVDCV